MSICNFPRTKNKDQKWIYLRISIQMSIQIQLFNRNVEI